ncbi:MAG: gliding motility-associated C-terminal domain-containing protein [Chitinophagaceae bacterium]|nr:MAG: gliding motility-associated C-terminal domain-containing protein [Chitinophagaceae bacterium]
MNQLRTIKVLLLLLLLLPGYFYGQNTCPGPGRSPRYALPLCGATDLIQGSVSQCPGTPLPYPFCGQNVSSDVNPYYYKFTCYQAGLLAFQITPNNLEEDYDWALFDVTNRDPNDIYTDRAMVICYNFSGQLGVTGVKTYATSCGRCGPTAPPFSKKSALVPGHDYLLLISHYTATDAGYRISFDGNEAVINDTSLPRMRSADLSCNNKLRVKLNKKIRCNSISSDGSEFSLPGGPAIVSATGDGCTTRFDTDLIELLLAAPLSPGTYTLRLRTGTDGNTLTDFCGLAAAVPDSIGFSAAPHTFTPMDSLTPPSCAPSRLRLNFRRPMQSASVAPDGSDFIVTGPYPVTVTGARGETGTDRTWFVELSLAAPMKEAGRFQVQLRQGNDGNTLLDECGAETPAGARLSFSVADTVRAAFSYVIGYGCAADTVRFIHPGGNGVNQWQWQLGSADQATGQNPGRIYTDFSLELPLRLRVSNGICTDSATGMLRLANYLKAGFEAVDTLCPGTPLQLRNSSAGRTLRYRWAFGDGKTSTLENPAPVYDAPDRTSPYWIELSVTDSFGCTKVSRKQITVLNRCFADVPNVFTPNSDGRNDRFRVINAVNAVDFELAVYNRWGGLMFKTQNWKEEWDGRFASAHQPAGVYVWTLRYVERDTGVPVFRTGTVLLLR